MRSDDLDITIESRGDIIWLILSGPFHKEQVPNIREKFITFLEDGHRYFTVDLDRITAIDDPVIGMFLTITSNVHGKNGTINFIFKNPIVTAAFSPYAHLLPVFPDEQAISARGFLGRLKRRSFELSRKTGVRLSRSIALFLLIILCGWFLSLLFIIHLQSDRITGQQKELTELSLWKKNNEIELTRLRERIKPLEQLGILRDTANKKNRAHE